MNRLLWLMMLVSGAVGTYLSVLPGTTSSGHLPRYYRIVLEVDIAGVLITVPGQAAATTAALYTINFGGLSALQAPAVLMETWVPFIKGLSATAFSTVPPAAATVATNAAANLFVSATENSIPSTCSFLTLITSADGRSLTIVDRGQATQAAAGVAGVPCLVADLLWELEIPAIFLAANPAYAEVLVSYTLSWVTGNAANPPTIIDVSVPWATTSTELLASALHFHKVVPSSTIQGAQLTSMAVHFTPGVQLTGGMFISLLVRSQPGVVVNAGGIFVVIRNIVNAAAGLPTIAIGVDGCSATPSDIYCCSSSVVSQPADSTENLRFQLFPLGCALPAGKLVIFTIPQIYLSTNPAIAAVNAGAAGFTQAAQTIVLNAYLTTSGETAGTIEARLGRPIVDPTANTPDDLSVTGTRTVNLVANAVGFANYFTSWGVGPSQVSGFTAVPSSLTTNVVPSSLVLSWVLATSMSFSTVAANLPPRFLVTSNPGVFRPNVGTFAAQRTLSMIPLPCNAATYYTNEYGSLIITPNPGNVAACYTALSATTRVTFTVPQEALRPNPSGNTQVRFDVIGLLEVALNGAVDNFWANAIDSAVLKDQLGYVTTTGCNTEAVPTFTFTSPSDISNSLYADRCRLVAVMATLSQGPAAIQQCPLSSTGTVTWAKLAEGTWRASSWPMTNVAALGTWAQVVGSNPSIAITNWGHMVTYPMFAIVVTYPPVAGSLQSLGITDSVPVGWTLAFIVRNDRLTLTCAAASNSNPWEFLVITTAPIVAVKHIGASGTVSAVQALTGGAWAQRADQLVVIVPQSGVVFGYTAVTASPIPDDGSDDALFGLLALIAVPVLLCCCLLALLWFLRPKAEACPCVPEYPVQEMYWVNAQPCAPTFSVAQCGPSTTPVYLVQ